jgi:hypothetical protein
MQTEVIHLKPNTILKAKFQELPTISTADDATQFWKFLPYENVLYLRKFSRSHISTVLQVLISVNKVLNP